MARDEQARSTQFLPSMGSLYSMDCTAMETVSAHQQLGQEAREQIWRILYRRLDEFGDAAQVCAQLRLARKSQRALLRRMQDSSLTVTIREALKQYAACLSAWADGAGLAGFSHPLLAAWVDDEQVGALDLATLLQEDEVGCQTGAYRDLDGAVIVWHTEEDVEKTPGERFDKVRLFSFRAFGDAIATGFIYPDLLPGPSFAWQTGYGQAVDTLHVKFVDIEHAILPNTFAWISLYLGANVSPTELAEQLGPFRGGYSLTTVKQKNGRVDVEKVEIANDLYYVSTLANSQGNYFFQTNVIRDLGLPIGTQEHTSLESRAWNEKRMARTERFMTVIRRSPQALPCIFRMLRSRLGDDSAYANHDVKGRLVCRMTLEETNIWAGAGPPMTNDDFLYFRSLHS